MFFRRIDRLMTAMKYKKCGFPDLTGKKKTGIQKSFWFVGTNHTFHWHVLSSEPQAKPAFCHLTVLASWLFIGSPNGHWSQAWGMAWQKLQLCGAVLQCEPPSLGPEQGSSWSPGAFLEKTTERWGRKLFFLASIVLSPLFRQPVVLVE